MKSLFALIFLLLITAAAVLFGSPYYTAYQLKNAYDAQDGEAVVSYVDFTQLPNNIEQQLKNRFDTTLQDYPLVARLGGDALTTTANVFIEESTKRAITADNISGLINTQGQANQATKDFAATWAIASNRVDLQALIQDMIVQRGDIDSVLKSQVQLMVQKQSSELANRVQTGDDTQNPKLSYCGINCFTLSGTVKGYPVTIEMQREGFIDWKIVDVVLP